MRGKGDSFPSMIIILSNICVVHTVLLFVIMSFYYDVRGIALTYPIAWSLTALCLLIYYGWRQKGQSLKSNLVK